VRVVQTGSWRRCSACKQPIGLGAGYWVCNVSTCNRKRTGLVFCTVSCWEVHLPEAHHREAWAVERTAPATPEAPEAPASARPTPAAPQAAREPRRIFPTSPPPSQPIARQAPFEVLIVASRLKDYIQSRSGFNTSDRVLDPLSDIVRDVCDEAIENARRDGRRTVLERDIPDRR
jgi:hypothetical protein